MVHWKADRVLPYSIALQKRSKMKPWEWGSVTVASTFAKYYIKEIS